MNLCTVDCVVCCDVEIIKVGRDFVTLWNIIECSVCRRCDSICVSKTFGLFQCLLGPYAGLKIAGLVFEQVHSHIEESHAGATAEEEHFVSIRDIEEFLPECAAFVHDGAPFLASV